MSYIGRVRPTETTSSVLRSTYTGDGSTTTYNLPGPVSDETAIIATINGVTQQDAAYTTNGSQIIFSGAPALGDSIELRTISAVAMSYAPADGSVVTGKIADGAVTSGKLATGAAVSNIGARAITAGQVPADSIIQVINSVRTAGDATTSATFVATGLSVTITPKFANSRILIICTAPLYNAGDNFHQYTTIYRGGSNLVTNEMQLYSSAGSATGRWTNGSMTYLDSPNTTSPTTYTVYFRSITSGQQVNYGTSNQVSVMTVMEIAA